VETPPKDDLFRAVFEPGYELRDSEDGGMPTLMGHFARFDEWTEIDSIFEGHFMERIGDTAFNKTIKENRASMRVLFQHGQDPSIGDKVLGPISALRVQEQGPYYEVPLLDTSYNRDLIPGLEAGLYGASFRFQVMKEEFESEPKSSKSNPEGLPERTITEAKVREFGPVTWPAYAGATAGVRSLTDEFRLPGIRELLAVAGREAGAAALQKQEPVTPKEPTTPPASRSTPARFRSREEFLEWIDRS
jgi:HK97 family phage prohead protease